MTRVKRGNVGRRRHKRILKAAKGYRGARHRWVKLAKQSVMRSDQFAYRDRRQRKRDFRRLWIARINAAARPAGLSYSRLMEGLGKAGVEIDRKQMADLAVRHPAAFSRLVEVAKEGIA